MINLQRDMDAEHKMDFIKEIITEVRRIRGGFVTPNGIERPVLIISGRSKLERDLIEEMSSYICRLAKISGIKFENSIEE